MTTSDSFPLISVCVINYNNERFLPDSLGSIAAQTYPNIELVFCDDGSTDQSVTTFEEIVSKHPKLRVNRQLAVKNMGIEANMLAGLRGFSGDFVCNLDADDVMHPRHIETLYRLITEHDADISSTSSVKFIDSNSAKQGIDQFFEKKLDLKNEPVCFSRSEMLEGLFFIGEPRFPYHYWHRLYRRELMKPFSAFDNSYFTSSDSAFSLVAFCEARKMAFQDVATVAYRVRSDSAMHKSSYEHFTRREYRSLNRLCDFYAESCPGIEEHNAHKDDLVMVEILNSAVRENKGYRAFHKAFREHFGKRPTVTDLEILFHGAPTGVLAKLMRSSLKITPLFYYLHRKFG